MVSPQPIDTLTASSPSSKLPPSCQQTLVAPSPTMNASMQKATQQTQKHSYGVPHPPRIKRTTSFINMQTDDPQPYFWSLNDENLPANVPHPGASISPSTDLFLADMPPMQYSFGEDLPQYNFAKTNSFAPLIDSTCERCWEGNSTCDECMLAKQNQFTSDGWPMEEQPNMYDQYSYMKGEPYAMNDDHSTWIKSEPIEQQHHRQQEDHPMEETEEKSTDGLPPLSAPLNVGDGLERVQGKLTKFLPDGQMMQVDYVDPNYTTAFEHQVTHAPTLSGGRSMRQRRAVQRSRSPSPDLSDRSTTPDSFGSDYDTDQYDPLEDEPIRYQPKHHPVDQHMMDDTISPPVVRYDDSSSSGQSSSEPPQPTRLLPVSAKELLPSRPSTAAVPPAHIKDRLVKSAKKLLTAADGVNDSVQVHVIPIWYPAKGASGAHKIRLIRVENTADRSVSVYAHAADVGGVVERKSNISRLFGKFESPSEKLLMNVVGAHNHTVGQESNILTSKGVRKFLALNKMKDENSYRAWINSVLLPKLLHDPLEIGEELLEIEASTDPSMPHQIKPKKMKRMEKKQQRREQEKKEAELAEKKLASQPLNTNGNGGSSPPAKRQKYIHSPISNSTALFLSPNMAPFNPFLMQQQASPFTLGANGANASA